MSPLEVICLCLVLPSFVFVVTFCLAWFLQKPDDELRPKQLPKVSILIAARNEEKNIARCLDALMEMDYPKDNLEINADLVCLSACQTGLGKISKGEGIIGLSRALIYAGANNLVVSYWTVSDASTFQLMKDFYEAFPNGDQIDHYAPFLQAAKLKMIQTEEYAHPYYWAGFTMVGSPW